jgi:hypothetical protein
MSYFLKSGNTFRVTNKEQMDLHDQLPAGNYTVKQDAMTKQFYLEKIDSFEIKGKLYGNTTQHANRILNTFKDRTSSTGVMLTGEKGSGKTLLSKCGEGFNSFLQMIEQPCVILFDEFEKVYDREDQEKMLTLLDGVYPSKKLFILTCNDKWRVDSHMRNRPGRIFYMLDFRGLDASFIREYCEDNLNDKHHIESVCRIGSMFSEFNFDMLKAMVEDMNRYGETPQEVMQLLNAKPEFSDEGRYTVSLQVNGIDIDSKKTSPTEWRGNPLSTRINIDYRIKDDTKTVTIDDDEDDETWEDSNFFNTDLKQVDPQTNKFVFVNEDGDRLVLTKVKERTFHYDAF